MNVFDEQSAKISDTIFNNLNKLKHEEYQYLNLIDKILDEGVWEEGRNGRTKSIFGHSMRFSLKENKIPILTTKKTAWKTCLKELLWFIRGQTDNNLLKEQGVHIWDANGSREFLDSRGLNNYEVDELGPIYSWQWRNFNKPYVCNKEKLLIKDKLDEIRDYNMIDKALYLLNNDYFKLVGDGVDQLQQIVDILKDPSQRNSRRIIMTAWNPCQLDQMALPPCHVLCQFSVKNGDELSCALYQRSADVFLGQPFNIASYSFMTHLLAKHCGLKASEFIYFMGDCHIYENAVDACHKQIEREPFEFPTVSIKQVRENINDYQVDDFEVHDYNHHPQIKVDMVA